jgi:ERCC4-type nuclease
MESGRLGGHQLRGLTSSYRHVYLLVEGLWKADKEGVLCRWVGGGWKPIEMGSRRYMARELERYLNSMMVMGGVHLWRTASLEESGRWIGEIYSWWSKEWEKHKSCMGLDSGMNGGGPVGVPMRRPSLVWRVAKELDGVGWGKGRAIADTFGSVMDLALADEEELRRASGIGKKLARGIVKQIKGE